MKKTKKLTWYNLPNLLDDLIGKIINKKDDSILEVWAGSQTEYSELQSIDKNTLYFVTEENPPM